MKKYILHIALLLLSSPIFSQVKVEAYGGIAPTGLSPSASMEDIRGYMLSVQDIAERNSIVDYMRIPNMTVLVREDTSFHTLVGGITNDDWEIFDFGLGSSGGAGEITEYTVIDVTNTPPGSPASGDRYRVGTAPTGAWVGHANDIATWTGSEWEFIDPDPYNYAYQTTDQLTYQYKTNNTWVLSPGRAIMHNGNNISGNVRFGSNNNVPVRIESGNIVRIDIAANGQVKFNVVPDGVVGVDSILVKSGGILKAISPTAFATPYTFTNGITNISGTVKWGGNLIENTDITQGSNRVTFSGNTTDMVTISNLGSRALSVDGYGGTAIQARAYSGNSPLDALVYSTSLNTVNSGMSVIRGVSGLGTVSSGFGISIDMKSVNSVSAVTTANTLISEWESATNGTETSKFSITGKNVGTLQTQFSLAGSGLARFNQYTTSNFYQNDTADYKPIVVGNDGTLYRSSWLGGGGSSGTLQNAYDASVVATDNPTIATGENSFMLTSGDPTYAASGFSQFGINAGGIEMGTLDVGGTQFGYFATSPNSVSFQADDLTDTVRNYNVISITQSNFRVDNSYSGSTSNYGISAGLDIFHTGAQLSYEYTDDALGAPNIISEAQYTSLGFDGLRVRKLFSPEIGDERDSSYYFPKYMPTGDDQIIKFHDNGDGTFQGYWANEGGGGSQNFEDVLQVQGSDPFTTTNTANIADQVLELQSDYGSLVVGGEEGAKLKLTDDTSNAYVGIVPASEEDGGVGAIMLAANADSSHIIRVYPNIIKIIGSPTNTHLQIQGLDSSDAPSYSGLWIDENGFVHRGLNSGGGGATAFTDLTDVPSSYSGEALKSVRVNSGETGLEFYTIDLSSLVPYTGATTDVNLGSNDLISNTLVSVYNTTSGTGVDITASSNPGFVSAIDIDNVNGVELKYGNADGGGGLARNVGGNNAGVLTIYSDDGTSPGTIEFRNAGSRNMRIGNSGNIYFDNLATATGTDIAYYNTSTDELTYGTPTFSNLSISRPIVTTGSNPSVTAGAAAGTSPTVSVSASSNDVSGVISVTTGTSPSAGLAELVTVTFNTALSSTPKAIILSPASGFGATGWSSVFVDEATWSTTSFKIMVRGGATLTASSSYKWSYHIYQ